MKWRPAGLLLLLAGCAPADSTPPTTPRLHYITSARQFGPVAFRDPLGAMSPDGEYLAWSVQQHLYLQRVDGGAVRELSTEPGVIVHLSWLPDSRGIAAEHRGGRPSWWRYDVLTGRHEALLPPGHRARPDAPLSDSLHQLGFAPDGRRTAGVRDSGTGSELWIFGGREDSGQVIRSAARLSYPVFAPDGRLVCMARDGKRQLLRDPCGADPGSGPAIEAYGPPAFSPRGETLYYAAPNDGGTLDLWARSRGEKAPVRLTNFGRDAYAPTVARNGSVLFKLQSYRTVVGVIDSIGGPVRVVADFQSETPSWDPTGKWIGITYGTWRRVIDDFGYPDIAQDAGIIRADPDSIPHRPEQIVDNSPSEDQSLTWSPNGKWIAYHSHKDHGDDLYLVPADHSQPARRITGFGRGFETGWPRWSPDGKWLVFDADAREAPHQSVIYVLGVDQETGAVTRPERALALDGFAGEAVHAEWLGGSDRLAVLGDESADRHVILLTSRTGGPARVLHRWQSEHRFSGLGVSPDGKWAAFIAPADGNHFQLFRIPVAGGPPDQLTFDPTNKTQPSYAPNGQRIALTVWDYQVQFWTLR